jgi:hypothetical protein
MRVDPARQRRDLGQSVLDALLYRIIAFIFRVSRFAAMAGLVIAVLKPATWAFGGKKTAPPFRDGAVEWLDSL